MLESQQLTTDYADLKARPLLRIRYGTDRRGEQDPFPPSQFRDIRAIRGKKSAFFQNENSQETHVSWLPRLYQPEFVRPKSGRKSASPLRPFA
jgi:hypothetical protein